MDFSEALKWLKDGMKVTRNGWTSGRYVRLRLSFLRDDPEIAAKENASAALVFEPFLELHTADATPVYWVPTASDLFATDWLCASPDGVIAWPDGTVA